MNEIKTDTKAMNRAMFIDRDNTIIIDKGYLHNPEDIEFLPGVLQALRMFQATGFLNIMVSNQSGIGRGYFSESDYISTQNHMDKLFIANSIKFTAYYYCPHSPSEDCECRKPKPLMAFKAAREFHINLKESYMIGDKDSDIEFGKNFGAKFSFRSIEECVKAINTVSQYEEITTNNFYEFCPEALLYGFKPYR